MVVGIGCRLVLYKIYPFRYLLEYTYILTKIIIIALQSVMTVRYCFILYKL